MEQERDNYAGELVVVWSAGNTTRHLQSNVVCPADELHSAFKWMCFHYAFQVRYGLCAWKHNMK